MADYWVSKKKYFCKYCDIYIADDAPSRQHHESGMRHKGNLERYIRGIYKTGEKRKKDLEEEKREMAVIERAANAAYAQDVGAGLAKGSSAPVASTSAAAARQPPPKPSNPYANYTTAAQLGFSDPDVERLAAERAVRQSQGVAGEWEVVAPAPLANAAEPSEEEEVKPDVEGSSATPIGEKRPADDSESIHDFRFRKKRITTGLGEIYDPGVIKVKKREEPKKEPSPAAAAEDSSSVASQQPPKWTPVQLKRLGDTADGVVKTEPKGTDTESLAQEDSTKSTTLKWTKSSWGAATQYPKPEDAAPVKEEESVPTPPTLDPSDVKDEVPEASLPPPPADVPGPVFKKRKVPPSTAGKGRRF